MSDCVTTALPGQPIYNGIAIVSISKVEAILNQQGYVRDASVVIDDTDSFCQNVENKLSRRNDDTQYYKSG